MTPYILARPAHQDVEIMKSSVPHPLGEGFAGRMGDLQGQLADYGMRLQDGRGIHVREYSDRFLAHWDKVDPSGDPFGHLVQDAPHWIVIGVFAGLFALLTVTYLLGGDSDSA